jgi:electron transfer flavoprotein beta subunit
MKIAVCIKQTPDTTTRVQIAADGKSVVEDDIQWIINPHDEAALEAALKLTEAQGGDVTVFSLGPERVEKAIREALAMGAAQAVRLHAERVPVDPLATARALAAALQGGGYDLILAGRQAVDDDNSQVPLLLAHLLGVASVNAADELTVEGGKGTALREIEGGHERVTFSLPAVVGINRRMNEPRYPSFKNIMMAKKKPIDVRPAEVGTEKVVLERLVPPPQKEGGKIFQDGSASAGEVVRLLHEEAKVL